ncbi:gamma-glutamylcyclotransferase family protein [Gimesia sp.]|uniref:gamma-glutamylcyclotransferase family protein n=1 Tax=Gimesia sp. TaxID=2024833 RepID=UPI003A925682
MMTANSDTLIFVYGTLKRGFCRAHNLQGQTFLSTAKTTAEYTMYNCGTYPGLVRNNGDGISIQGELWRVDHRALKLLDEVEGVAENLYQRGPIQLIQPQVTETVEAYFYQRPVNQMPVIGDNWC